MRTGSCSKGRAAALLLLSAVCAMGIFLRTEEREDQTPESLRVSADGGISAEAQEAILSLPGLTAAYAELDVQAFLSLGNDTVTAVLRGVELTTYPVEAKEENLAAASGAALLLLFDENVFSAFTDLNGESVGKKRAGELKQEATGGAVTVRLPGEEGDQTTVYAKGAGLSESGQGVVYTEYEKLRKLLLLSGKDAEPTGMLLEFSSKSAAEEAADLLGEQKFSADKI